MILGLVLCLLLNCVNAQTPPPPFPESEAIKLIFSLNNWNRWGPDDQLGLLNLVITPEKRQEALSIPQTYEAISVSRDLDFNTITPATIIQSQRMMEDSGEDRENGPQPGRTNFAYEYVGFVFHGQTITHMDSLSHYFWMNIMYGNRSAGLVTTRQGATVSSVVNAKLGIMTRGVLIDIPLVKGENWLSAGNLSSYIYPDDLKAAVVKSNITINPGDAVLLRTGFWNYNLVNGMVDPRKGCPGLHPTSMIWLKSLDVAILGTDTPGEVEPPPYPHLDSPVHQIGIVGMGITILDNCDYEQLAIRCAAQNQYYFMLSFAPLPLVNGTGSPVNPIVLF